MGAHPKIPRFDMYTEVIQDAVIALVKSDKFRFASGCSLSVSNPILRDIYENLDFFRSRLVLRPQEITSTAQRSSGVLAFFRSIPQSRWTLPAT